jgi:Flp pilus assembly protein TadD
MDTDVAFAAAKAHHRAGRLAEAEQFYRTVLMDDPRHHGALALLGVLAHQCGDSTSAEKLIRGAIALNTDAAPYHNHLGVVLRAQGRRDEAEACFRHALVLMPDLAEACANLGSLLGDDDPDAALPWLQMARILAPDDAEIAFNLGNGLRAVGRSDEAIAAYRTSIALKPEHAEAHVNLGLTLLANGAFSEGGAEYDWRWRLKPPPSPPQDFGAPEWDGHCINGTLLLHTEQGLGDTIQFCRFARLAAERCRRVVLQVPPALQRLLSALPVEVIASGKPLPHFDAHCALMSLPWRLGVDCSSLALEIPYLQAESDRIALWRARLPDGLRIGIAWQGNPAAKFDRRRSIPLHRFAALAREGVHLIALQKHHGLDQAGALPNLVLPGPDFDDGPDAFLDTAAIIMSVDVVVTSDTAVAHLAGALSRQVWLALPHSPDWRWQLGNNATPWYPTMRLFRQTCAGDWSNPFAVMAAELQNLTTPETS